MRSGSFLTANQVKSFGKLFTEVHKLFFQGVNEMFRQYKSAYTHNVMGIDSSQPKRQYGFFVSVTFRCTGLFQVWPAR